MEPQAGRTRAEVGRIAGRRGQGQGHENDHPQHVTVTTVQLEPAPDYAASRKRFAAFRPRLLNLTVQEDFGLARIRLQAAGSGPSGGALVAPSTLCCAQHKVDYVAKDVMLRDGRKRGEFVMERAGKA